MHKKVIRLPQSNPSLRAHLVFQMYLADMNCKERFMLFLLKVMYIGESVDLTSGERGQQPMLYVILDFTQTKPSCIAMILVLASCCWLNVKVRREWCKCSDCVKGFVFFCFRLLRQNWLYVIGVSCNLGLIYKGVQSFWNWASGHGWVCFWEYHNASGLYALPDRPSTSVAIIVMQ